MLHLCLLPKRPEEGVRSLELESRWLEATIRGYWQSNLGLSGMLGIKPWSSVRASCALNCEPSLQPQRSDLRLEGAEAVQWTNSGWRLNQLQSVVGQEALVTAVKIKKGGRERAITRYPWQSPWIKEQVHCITPLEKIRRTPGNSKIYQFHLCFPLALLVVHTKLYSLLISQNVQNKSPFQRGPAPSLGCRKDTRWCWRKFPYTKHDVLTYSGV